MICLTCLRQWNDSIYWTCPYCDGTLTEEQPKEETVIPEGKGSSDFKPWLKLPNQLENKEGDVKVGDTVMIKTEPAPSDNPKIKAFLLCEVELMSGEVKALGLNMTTYYEIARTFGKDTKDWVDKVIKYQGMKKFNKGTGHLWSGVK